MAAAELYPPMPNHVVIAIADALGATDTGLTGAEIGRTLARARIVDLQPQATKRHRLAAALLERQSQDRAANCIIRFITEAMGIGQYLQYPDRFEQLRQNLDPALSLAGFYLRDDGRMGRRKTTAKTLDDVAALTGRLTVELERRGVHEQVLRYCREELLRRSTFHAVSEASKGVCDRLRSMTGLTSDGTELVEECFSTRDRRPLVRINDFETKSEASEHTGFANLLKGVIGTFPTPPRTLRAWPGPSQSPTSRTYSAPCPTYTVASTALSCDGRTPEDRLGSPQARLGSREVRRSF